jgi:hypothetical protein
MLPAYYLSKCYFYLLLDSLLTLTQVVYRPNTIIFLLFSNGLISLVLHLSYLHTSTCVGS